MTVFTAFLSKKHRDTLFGAGISREKLIRGGYKSTAISYSRWLEGSKSKSKEQGFEDSRVQWYYGSTGMSRCVVRFVKAK